MKIILIGALLLCEIAFTIVEKVWRIPSLELTESVLNKSVIESHDEQEQQFESANS